MAHLTPLSFPEQVAEHLRREICRGTWPKRMPGAPRLSRELGVDPKTVLAALGLLEREKLLIPQGAGKPRLVNTRRMKPAEAPPLRIAILPHDRGDHRIDYILELQDSLVAANHRAYYVDKTVQDFGRELKGLSRFVKAEKADAWIVISGPKHLLEWFAASPHPTFALFGRFGGVPVAATMPEKIPAYMELVDRLVALGHRRISLLVREDRRLPEPGRTERAVLDRLSHHGISTSTYNIPEWKDSKAGLHDRLSELFRITPPTALITQEAFVFHAAYHFVSQQGLRIPRDVSIACSNDDPTFGWCEPPVSHISWDSKPITRRIVKWAANVCLGKGDKGQNLTMAKFIEGGTIGPVQPRP